MRQEVGGLEVYGTDVRATFTDRGELVHSSRTSRASRQPASCGHGSMRRRRCAPRGEIYAAIGWRLKENFEGAGKTVDLLFGYLVDGMNYTPSGPYFEDMQDGIVQATALADQCLVWDAFADFGVGVGASATVGRQRGKTVVTVVESFAVPSTCNP